MKQQNSVTVHGGIHGGNNRFDNRNYHIKNINNGGGGKKGGGDEGIAVVVAVFLAVIVAAYAYLTHYGEIIFWLKVGVAVAGAIHLAAFIPLWRDPEAEYRDLWPIVIGAALTCSQAWLLISTIEALPAAAIEIATRPTAATGIIPQAIEVWRRFNATGHRVVVENLTTAITLAPAIVLNVFFALQHVLQSLARSEASHVCETLADWLHVCRSRGSVVSAMLVVAAFFVISGIFTQHIG